MGVSVPTELSTLRLGPLLGEGATSRVLEATLPDGTPAVMKIARERAQAPILAHEAWVTSVTLSSRLPQLLAVGVFRCEGDRALADATGLP